MRSSVRLLPQVGELVRLHDLEGGVVHDRRERIGDLRCEELRPRWKATFNVLFERRVDDERVRDPVGERVLDVGVVGQRRHRRDVGAGVEDLSLQPHAYHRHRRQDTADDDEHSHDDPSPDRNSRFAVHCSTRPRLTMPSLKACRSIDDASQSSGWRSGIIRFG